MGERTHTPGPWRIDQNHGHYVVCDHAPLVVAVCGSSLTQETRETNARLIAAAPDMFEALRFFACIDFDNFTEHDEALLESVRAEAAAALAKASPHV